MDFDPFAQVDSPIEGMSSKRHRKKSRSTPTRARENKGAPSLTGSQTLPLTDIQNAKFGQRLAAFGLDFLILHLPFLILSGSLAAALPKEWRICEFNKDGETIWKECEELTSASGSVLAILFLVYIAFQIFWYYGTLEGRGGATPGKRLIGLKTVDQITGLPIGVNRAILRWIMRVFSALPFFLGFFWALWDKNHRTWHDAVVRCRIIYPIEGLEVSSVSYPATKSERNR